MIAAGTPLIDGAFAICTWAEAEADDAPVYDRRRIDAFFAALAER